MTFHFPIFQFGVEGLAKLLPGNGGRKWLAATLFTALGFGLGQSVQLFGSRYAPNTQPNAMQQIWHALDHGQPADVVQSTGELIRRFGPAAEREQARLERSKAPTPPVGEATLSSQREVQSRGVLNDTATAYVVRAEVLERMGLTGEAKAAYQAASKLTYARAWDDRSPGPGFFWSPAEAASDQLRRFK